MSPGVSSSKQHTSCIFRAILEANNGVAAVYSESGGDLTLVTSPCRSDELDNLLLDLKSELGSAWLLGPLV